MIRPDVIAFVFLAGLGCGVALSLLAAWAASKLIRETLPEPVQALPGVMVRDSSMGEFDAAVRRGS